MNIVGWKPRDGHTRVRIILAEHSCVRPLPCDELAMPPKQRIGCHNGGNLAQGTPTQPVRSRGQSSPVVIGETQPPPTQLPAQEAVLFDQVGARLPFAAFEPAG